MKKPATKALFFFLAILVLAVLSVSCDKTSSNDAIVKQAESFIEKAKEHNDLSWLQKAEASYKKAITNDSDDITPYILLGDLYMDEDEQFRSIPHWRTKMPHAERMYKKALALAPDDPDVADAYVGLAWFYTNGPAGASEKAIPLLHKAIELAPDNKYARNDLGACYFKLKMYTESKAVFTEILQKGRAENDEYNIRRASEYLGRIYTIAGDYEKAEEFLTKSAKGLDRFLEENDLYWGCPYQALGELYSLTGRPRAGAEQYMKAADAEKFRAKEQFSAALACWEAGDIKNGIKYVDRAIKLEQNPDFDCLKGFLLMMTQDYTGAEHAFDSINFDNGVGKCGKIGKGHISLIKKDFAGAFNKIKSVLENPENESSAIYAPDDRVGIQFARMIHSMAYLGLGWAKANQNKHAQAITHFDSVLETNPSNIFALLGKGNSLSGLKNLKEAGKYFEKVLALDPENPYALAEVALVQYNTGDFEKSEENFNKALKVNPISYTCPYEGLGLIYLRQGKLDKARQNFQKAIEINPSIEYKKFNGLAKIYIKEGNVDKARELLNQSVKNYPYDEEAKNLLKKIGSENID